MSLLSTGEQTPTAAPAAAAGWEPASSSRTTGGGGGSKEQEPAPQPSTSNCRRVTWQNLEMRTGMKGEAVLTFQGKEIDAYTSKELRTMCSTLKLKGLTNATKQAMVDKINFLYRSIRENTTSLLSTGELALTTAAAAGLEPSSATRGDELDPLPSTNRCRNVTWQNLHVATGKGGEKFLQFEGQEIFACTSKELRMMCNVLKVQGVTNATKREMAEKLLHAKMNNDWCRDPPDHKEVQSRFRLLNILFLDLFCEPFLNLRKSLARDELDARLQAKNESFWLAVLLRFLDDKPDSSVNDLQFDDIVIVEQKIDPSQIVLYSWEKLEAMYKHTAAGYKRALANFNKSGNSSNFYDFCNGRLDVFYLHKFLELNPVAKETVTAERPDVVVCDSHGATKLTDSSSSSTLSNKRKANSAMRSELSKVKIKLLEKQIVLDEKKFEHTMEKIKIEQAHLTIATNKFELEKAQFDIEQQGKIQERWERTVASIKRMRDELAGETNPDNRRDMESNIAKLSKIQHRLEGDLGML